MNKIKLKKEYDRKRYLEKKDFLDNQHKEYYYNNREKIINRTRKYRGENREMINKYMACWRLKHKNRIHAYNQSKSIKIPKGTFCKKYHCYNLATEKHHPNYNKPKLVIFLCHNCHLFEHGRGLKLIK